jgi:hypothetical protein
MASLVSANIDLYFHMFIAISSDDGELAVFELSLNPLRLV